MKRRVLLGGYSSEVPPLPIPNREVKLTNADGTAYLGGRVGSRLFKRRPNVNSIFSFLFAEISATPYLKCDLAVRSVLSKSHFFITALHNSSANRKIERSKFGLLWKSIYTYIIYMLCRGAAKRSREQIASGNPRQVKRKGGEVIFDIYYIWV